MTINLHHAVGGVWTRKGRGAAPVEPPPPPATSALLGAYMGNPSSQPDERFAAEFGHPDIMSSYYQASGRPGGTINSTYEVARSKKGTIPLITVTSTGGVDSSGNVLPMPYTMPEIGNGTADSWIIYWRDQLKKIPGEVWFTFDHEHEVKHNQGLHLPATNEQEYAVAYNRFMSIVKNPTTGASNVKFLYWYGYSDVAAIDLIGSLINPPDMFAFDPYVFANRTGGSTTTFAQMAQPKLDWLRSRSWYADQPIIFAEFAKDTSYGDTNVANFLTDLRREMDALGMHGAVYFSRDKSGDIMADITGPYSGTSANVSGTFTKGDGSAGPLAVAAFNASVNS